MGVNSFSTLLKKYAQNCEYEIPLESLRGKRISIDTPNLAYIMKSGATKRIIDSTNLADKKPDVSAINNLTLDMILSRLEVFIQYGITPVCVFDGKHHELKNYIQEKRKDRKDKIKAKLLKAETDLYNTEPLFRNSILTNEYAKYYKQSIGISLEFTQQLKTILSSSGFPVISAENINTMTNDAEGICASLCIKGNDQCFAAFTTDSDFHVYGGDLAIVDIYSKYVFKNGVNVSMHFAKIRSLEAILKQMDIPFESFRDLCILLGTDFNSNIKGIGPVNSWKLIQQYKTIDNIVKVKSLTAILAQTHVTFDSFKYLCTLLDTYFNSWELMEQYKTLNELATIDTLVAILTQSKIEFESFQNLYTLLGTKFNNEWKFVCQYNTISNVAKIGDISVLHHTEVTKMYLSSIIKLNNVVVDFNKFNLKTNAREVLSQYDLQHHINTIISYVESLTSSIDTETKITNTNNTTSLLSNSTETILGELEL